MLRTLAIGTLVLVGASAAVYADVFRWVDDHGGVHYSDKWVPGSEVIKSTKPHPASTESYAKSHASDQGPLSSSNAHAADMVTQQGAAQAVKQDVAKIREQQCKEAKERYDKAIQARRIFKAGKDDKAKDTDRPDDRQYMSDEEADAYRLKARTEMQQYCGNSGR
jgi:hypothetical protein